MKRCKNKCQKFFAAMVREGVGGVFQKKADGFASWASKCVAARYVSQRVCRMQKTCKRSES